MSQHPQQPPYYTPYPSDPSKQYAESTQRSYTPGPPSSAGYHYSDSYARPASTQPPSPPWTRQDHPGYSQSASSSNYVPSALPTPPSPMHLANQQYYSSTASLAPSSPTYPQYAHSQPPAFLPTPSQLMQSNQASHTPPLPYRRHSIRDQAAAASLPADGTRYPCGLCTKTFSRAYDRKRHLETSHAPLDPNSNKCQFCGKTFSRADSLKRHIDSGGCEQLAKGNVQSSSTITPR